jgi:ATP-binding cassette subfamily C protein CydD
MEWMQTHKRLISFSWKAGALLPLTVFAGFLSSALIIFQSWKLSQVIDDLFLNHAQLAQVLPSLRLILVIIFARAVFTFVNDTLAGKLAVVVKSELRSMLLQKIDRLGPVWLNRQKSGEIAATCLQGVDALDSYFSQFLPQVVLSAILPLAILVFVWPLDLLTGIVFFVTAPLIPLFMVLIGRMAAGVTKRQWTKLNQMSDFLLDSIRGLKTLLLLGRGGKRLQEIHEVSEQYRNTTLNVLKITFLSAFVLEMVATISTAVVAVEIGLRLLYARIEFQQAFFILLIAPEFYIPMRNLSMRYHAGMTGVSAAASIFKLLDTPEDFSQPVFAISNGIPLPPQINQYYFHQVTFSYSGSTGFALSDFSFQFERDRLYALVGENGAGKSTLFHLLMQFLQPSSGHIDADGVNIQTWSPEMWRRNISWVGQKPALFNSSLLENVRLFDQSYAPNQVEDALEKALLGNLLQRLPHGLETQMLEAGVRFSSGERQRLALARAFLKNGSLVLLDEPTSHLDSALDKAFMQGLKELVRNKTAIMIAHHMPFARLADEVLVLEQSRLVETGKITDLIARDGHFSRLAKAGMM